MRYGSGVYKSCGCQGKTIGVNSVNHAVLLTGYGYDGQDHWQIKNSWGTGWGMDGYMILKKGNMCSVCKWGGERVQVP